MSLDRHADCSCFRVSIHPDTTDHDRSLIQSLMDRGVFIPSYPQRADMSCSKHQYPTVYSFDDDVENIKQLFANQRCPNPDCLGSSSTYIYIYIYIFIYLFC